MLADTLEHDLAAVEQEALLGVPLDLADAEGGELFINELVAAVDAGAQGVEVGRLDVPGLRLLHLDTGGERLGAAGGDADIAAAGGDDLFAVEDFLGDAQGGGGLGGVVDGGLHLHGGGGVGDARGGGIHAPVGDGGGRGGGEVDVAVDPGAGIPAGRLREVLQTDRDGGLFPCLDVEVDAERVVAIDPLAGELAVHIDLRLRHRAVEVEEQALVAEIGGRGEGLAIPTDALPRELAGFVFDGHFEGPLDRPVVGEVDLAPRGVVECEVLRLGLRVLVGVARDDRFLAAVERVEFADARPVRAGAIGGDPDVACTTVVAQRLLLFADRAGGNGFLPLRAVLGDFHLERVVVGLLPVDLEAAEIGDAAEVVEQPLVLGVARRAPAGLWVVIDRVFRRVGGFLGGSGGHHGGRAGFGEHGAAGHLAEAGELPVVVEGFALGGGVRGGGGKKQERAENFHEETEAMDQGFGVMVTAPWLSLPPAPRAVMRRASGPLVPAGIVS